jgi:hypothetical protein
MANPTTNLGMTKPTVGGSTDSWGTTLNVNVVDIIDALFSISGTDVTMSDIKFNSMSVQETGAGTDTVKIQAPAAVTTAYTLTMPAAVGSTNQVLSAADGTGTLAWTTPVVGDITGVTAGAGMTGGGTTGDVTLNVIGTADKVTVSADAVTIASTYVGQTSITTLGTIATGTWEGTTVAVNQGGTGATSLTDGGILLGSGTGAVTATAVLADGEILIGDGTTDPVALDVGSSTAITILGTVATGVWNGTAIANANLANSTVSYGGISLALGASDATPAFNLSDATAYTGDSSLVTVGTVASGTWNGTAVGVAYGGTAISSYAAGDILYASGATTLAKLAKGSDTEVLTLASGVPTWAAPTVGDITGVTAGTGLSGGGTTGTVTLNVEAAQTQITSVGALGAGSISSGFGAIDVGSSSIDGGTITGTFVGNVTGNASGSSGSTTGNAATSTALATARTIGGTSFDGTANIAVGLAATATVLATNRDINGESFDGSASITVTAAAGTLTGGTLNSGVTASSITSVGTLSALTVTGTSSFTGDVTIVSSTSSPKKLILAQDGDTYIQAEVVGNQMDFYTSGVLAIRINGNADVDIPNGALSKQSGSFKIAHPLPDKKDTHHLVHSFVEGPRADLIYRGVADLSGGSATVDLDEAAGMSAGTWELLCRDPQVWVQNDSGWGAVRGSVEGNTLTIECEGASSSDTVGWMVVAERCDPHMMDTGWTDEDGRVIVEPLVDVGV